MKMTKPGKMIELTNSAQITAWRQRLDVRLQLLIFHRLRPRSQSPSTPRRSRNFKRSLIPRTPTCTISRRMRSRSERSWKSPPALTLPMTWLAATPRASTAKSASMRASGASTEKSAKFSRRNSVPLSLRKFHNRNY